MKLQFFYVVAACGALGLASCKAAAPKNPDAASNKSLDDLAHKPGEDAATYQCGGGALPDYLEPLRNQIEPLNSPFKDTVLGTATALPKPIALLLTGSNTRLRIVPDAAALCVGTPFATAEKGIAGATQPLNACWRQNAGERPELILQADASVIKRSFLRLGAYMFSEFLMKRVESASQPAALDAATWGKWKQAAVTFNNARGALAAALLIDLKAIDATAAAKFEQMNAVDPIAFGNIALAEAQDSYYCNDASRQSFATRFSKTYAVFANTQNPESMVSLLGAR